MSNPETFNDIKTKKGIQGHKVNYQEKGAKPSIKSDLASIIGEEPALMSYVLLVFHEFVRQHLFLSALKYICREKIKPVSRN